MKFRIYGYAFTQLHHNFLKIFGFFYRLELIARHDLRLRGLRYNITMRIKSKSRYYKNFETQLGS